MLARIAPGTLYFFFNDTATTEIYALSLHDALPISDRGGDHRYSCRHRDPEVREHQGEGVSRFDEVRPSEPDDRWRCVFRGLGELRRCVRRARDQFRAVDGQYHAGDLHDGRWLVREH